MNNATQKGIHIIDVRTPAEFYSAHADGAINIPLNELNSKIDYLRSLDGEIILCCASGMRSASALNVLQQYGITNAVNAGPWYVAQNMLIK